MHFILSSNDISGSQIYPLLLSKSEFSFFLQEDDPIILDSCNVPLSLGTEEYYLTSDGLVQTHGYGEDATCTSIDIRDFDDDADEILENYETWRNTHASWQPPQLVSITETGVKWSVNGYDKHLWAADVPDEVFRNGNLYFTTHSIIENLMKYLSAGHRFLTASGSIWKQAAKQEGKPPTFELFFDGSHTFLSRNK